MNLSIIIVNWNTSDLLARCLESIRLFAPDGPYEVWVVDNASTDSSAQMVRDQFPWVQLVEMPENVGFAAANNRAIQRARGQYILLLNSDTEVLSGALQFMIEALERSPSAGAAGPRMLGTDGCLQNSYGSLPTIWAELVGPSLFDFLTRPWGKIGRKYLASRLENTKCIKVDRVSFACILIRRQALQMVGLLDERFFFYSEDYDWFKRLKGTNWSVIFCSQAQVIHHWGASSRIRSNWATVQLYHSKLMYYEKHHGAFSKAVLGLGLAFRFIAKLLLSLISYPLQRGLARQRINLYSSLLKELPGWL